MDPGEVPEELKGLTEIEEMLIYSTSFYDYRYVSKNNNYNR